jgi:hypothetical protein
MFESVARKLNRLASLLRSKGYKEEALLIAQMLDPKLAPDIKNLETWWSENPNASLDDVMKKWQKENREKARDYVVWLNVQTTLQEKVLPEIEKQRQESKEYEEGLEESEENELKEYEAFGEQVAKGRRAEHLKKYMESIPEETSIFAPGEGKEMIEQAKRRGITEEDWGEGGHIKESILLLDEIAKRIKVPKMDDFQKGYRAVPYTYQSVPCIILYNIEPMKRGKTTKEEEGRKVERTYKGYGNAVFIVPQVADGKPWWEFVKNNRGGISAIINTKIKEKIPGWARLRRGSSRQKEVLNEALAQIRETME